MLTYDEARERLIEGLSRDVALHEIGDFMALGKGFEDLAAVIPRDQPPTFNKLLVALSFWDAWINFRNHQWPDVDRFPSKDEWPVLARELIGALQNNQEIMVGAIAQFGLQPWREAAAAIRELLRDRPEIVNMLPPIFR